MSLSRELRRAIERSDFASVEDAFLAQLDSDPTQLEFFVRVARSLAATGEPERSSTLLDLVDDQLIKSELWELRLQLLDGSRELHPSGARPYTQIVRTVEKIYGGLPSLPEFMEMVGLHRAVDDVPKLWEKVKRLVNLMQFEIGTVVAMEGKGVGRIVEVNTVLSSFKVDLDVGGEIRVGFRAAGKLLTALEEGHFLRRKVESPEELQDLKPSALLEALLASYDRPLVASEIKQAMTGLVAAKSWSSWWTAARKHPQLVADGAGAKRKYRWADTHAEAGAVVLKQFEKSNLTGQLAIFRKEAGRDAELAQAMGERLSEAGESQASSNPATAFSIAAALEKADLAGDDSDWSTESLVANAADPSKWIYAISETRVRRDAIALVREREDWAPLFLRIFGRETDAKLLDYIAGELGKGDPEGLGEALDQAISQPRKTPAVFVWAAERIVKDDHLDSKNPLRLIQMITSVGERPEFADFKPRLKQLVASTDCLATLIGRVEASQAAQAEEALRRAYLEDYQREQLTTALHLRFPNLRKQESVGLYALTDSIDERRRELKRLLEEEIPANRKAIEEARELGDLRENFEYKSARARHEYLSARVADIDGDLRRVQPIDISTVDGSEVRVGAVISLRAADGSERTLTILGPWESKPEEDIVSYESDVAQGLLGKAPGDVVEVLGDELTVESIDPAQG